jgi:hypothetical protein
MELVFLFYFLLQRNGNPYHQHIYLFLIKINHHPHVATRTQQIKAKVSLTFDFILKIFYVMCLYFFFSSGWFRPKMGLFLLVFFCVGFCDSKRNFGVFDTKYFFFDMIKVIFLTFLPFENIVFYFY